MKRLALAMLLAGTAMIFLAPAAFASVDVSLDVAPSQSKASQPPSGLPRTGVDALVAAAAACALMAVGSSLLKLKIDTDKNEGEIR